LLVKAKADAEDLIRRRTKMAEDKIAAAERVALDQVRAKAAEAATKAAVDKIIAEIGAGGLKDMGAVMGALRENYASQMDFGKASAIVKARLSG
ncbi:MAG: GatB/YqeY domain-containing protein, partial [Alphaproteobacteria bacterium]